MWMRQRQLTPFIPIVEHLQDAVCLENAGADALVVNAAGVALFGAAVSAAPMEEVPAGPAWRAAASIFQDPEDFLAHVAGTRAAASASSARSLATIDGRAIECEYSPVFVGGTLTAHLWQFRDTTRQRRLEASVRQGHRLNTVGRLAGGIAHDFNNQLTAVVGYCDVLDAQFDTGDVRRFDLHEIRNAAMRAAALTRQLLAFSRRQIMQPEIVDVAQMVGELHKMLSRLVGEQVTVEIAVPEDGAEVFADPGQIELALFSLAANAREAMPEGGTLRVEVERIRVDETRARALDVRTGPFVRLVVTDNGVGMDEATRSSAFDPFFTTRASAHGMGLPTVYGIVRQTGGAILLESAAGRGARVEIVLPQYVDAPPGTGAAEDVAVTRPATSAAHMGPATVLVVEDESSVLRLVRRLLESEGLLVLSAQDAEEALLLSEQHAGPIDLLLTDVVMPGITGLALAARVERQRPATRVLFMSGYAEHVTVQRDIIDAGRPFLQKPFAPDRLTARVREVLTGGN